MAQGESRNCIHFMHPVWTSVALREMLLEWKNCRPQIRRWQVWQLNQHKEYFVRGSITVQQASYLTGLDSIKLVNLFLIKHEQSSSIQTSQNRRSAEQRYFPLQSKRVFSRCILIFVFCWIFNNWRFRRTPIRRCRRRLGRRRTAPRTRNSKIR